MKVSNEMLEEYLEIEQELKALGKQFLLLKTVLKERGSFSTGEYVVAVTERSRGSLPGVKEMIEALGEKAIMPLIKTTTYLEVSVAKKAA